MGEIANDMIEGRCCSDCGQYFEDPDNEQTIYEHGYPVLCDWCWDTDCELQKAEVNTI